MNDPTAATILLVDDDDATRHIMQRWLTHLAVHSPVLQAANGLQALALVETHCQGGATAGSLLVLLDLSMPVMDGLTFLEQLPVANRLACTVVVVAAMASPTEWERVCALSADAKLKPLDIGQLTAILRKYLPAALPA